MTIEFIIGMALGLLIGAGVLWLVSRFSRSMTDSNLTGVANQLQSLQQAMQQSNESHAALNARITDANTVTEHLRQTADQLHQALANNQHRGQWGERMAEDVLRLVGLKEGASYCKQRAGDNNVRPDFTFFLPSGLKLNMDVKFPFNNYQQYLNAESENDKDQFRQAFITDVQNRINEVSRPGYINPPTTVDYALVFIPNEQVYAAIHEMYMSIHNSESSMIDYALKRKIVLCSPLTLYAMLSVIRQAAENAQMQQHASDMVRLIYKFMDQWDKFQKDLDKMGGQINKVSDVYTSLQTTRTERLEAVVQKIRQLQTAQGGQPDDDGESEENGNQ